MKKQTTMLLWAAILMASCHKEETIKPDNPKTTSDTIAINVKYLFAVTGQSIIDYNICTGLRGDSLVMEVRRDMLINSGLENSKTIEFKSWKIKGKMQEYKIKELIYSGDTARCYIFINDSLVASSKALLQTGCVFKY